MAGFFIYSALFTDFGDREHCLSPLRRYYEAKRQEYLQLSEQDLKGQCVALFDYVGATDEELSFKQGDEFVVLNKDAPDWWLVLPVGGNGHEGYVPCTYVRMIENGVTQIANNGPNLVSSLGGRTANSEVYSESIGDDENGDEEIDDDQDDIERVLRQQRIERRRSKLQMGIHTRKLVAPDPTQEATLRLPKGFAPSTMAKNYDLGVGHLGDFLSPNLDSSGLGFADLYLDSKNRLRKTTAKCNVAFSLIDARGVPTWANHPDIVGRHVRIALFDKTNILSNIHTVSAVLGENDRIWRFSTKASLLFPKDDENTCFLRANNLDIKLCLFVELCLMIADPSNQGSHIEISCGWGLLPLFSSDGGPVENKTYEVRLHGGSLFQGEIDFEEPPSKKGFLQGFVGSAKPPCIHIRVWKLGKDTIEQLK
eukprot:jgi/Hompol1/5402/HPOL_004388-RA